MSLSDGAIRETEEITSIGRLRRKVDELKLSCGDSGVSEVLHLSPTGQTRLPTRTSLEGDFERRLMCNIPDSDTPETMAASFGISFPVPPPCLHLHHSLSLLLDPCISRPICTICPSSLSKHGLREGRWPWLAGGRMNYEEYPHCAHTRKILSAFMALCQL